MSSRAPMQGAKSSAKGPERVSIPAPALRLVSPAPDLERGLGVDFSRLPVHTDSRPGEAASAVEGAGRAALRVSQPTDASEREAERTAEEIVRMESAPGDISPRYAGRQGSANTAARLQRACSKCQEEEEQVARKSAGETPATAPAIVHDVLASPGMPLQPETRAFFEPRFGADFSSVRIHTDPGAAEAAASVNALAYTVGDRIVFAEGQFSPGTSRGRHLLAHELAHVEQNRPRPGVAEGGLRRQAGPVGQPPAPSLGNDPNQPGSCGPGTDNPFCLPLPKLPCLPDQPDGSRPCSNPSLLPNPTEPCTPYPDPVAALNQWFMMKAAVPVPLAASTRCPVVASVWNAYLDRTSQEFNFSGDDCVGKAAKGNATGSATADASAQGFLADIFDNLPFLLRRVVPAALPLGGPVAELRLILADAVGRDPKDPSFHPKIEYGNPATDAAGNLAGGVGVNGQGSDVFGDDDRIMGGSVLVQVMGIDPITGAMSGTVRFQPQVHVKDTVDFCPGNLAGKLAQVVTVTLSKLEATGLAKDVPITIDYFLDVREEAFSVVPLVGPLPVPQPGPVPTPQPGPVPTPQPGPTPGPETLPTSYIVRPGDFLRKLAKKFYANENLWKKIYDANRDVIGGNPDLILPGQQLLIPE